MAFGLENLMQQGTDLGAAYLNAEIADHGNQKPVTRPDTNQVPAATVEDKKPMTTKTKAMIGGGVVLSVVVLALLLKK